MIKLYEGEKMRLNPVSAIVLSGFSWLAIALLLLSKGLTFLLNEAEGWPLFGLISLGVLVGFFKGRFVLSKSVNRVVERILSFSGPVLLSQIYSKGYCFLILGMMALGMCMKWLPISPLIRGTVDVGVGTALMQGALFYFTAANRVKRQPAK